MYYIVAESSFISSLRSLVSVLRVCSFFYVLSASVIEPRAVQSTVFNNLLFVILVDCSSSDSEPALSNIFCIVVVDAIVGENSGGEPSGANIGRGSRYNRGGPLVRFLGRNNLRIRKRFFRSSNNRK